MMLMSKSYPVNLGGEGEGEGGGGAKNSWGATAN